MLGSLSFDWLAIVVVVYFFLFVFCLFVCLFSTCIVIV